MQVTSKPADRTDFEKVIDSIEAQTANIGAHLTVDSSARLAYAREIKRMADHLRDQATRNRITWAQAAQQAELALPVIADPKGVSRPFAFHRRFRIYGRPKPETQA